MLRFRSFPLQLVHLAYCIAIFCISEGMFGSRAHGASTLSLSHSDYPIVTTAPPGFSADFDAWVAASFNLQKFLTPIPGVTCDDSFFSSEYLDLSQRYRRPDGVEFIVQWVTSRYESKCGTWNAVQASEFAVGEKQRGYYTEGAETADDSDAFFDVQVGEGKGALNVIDPNQCLCAIPFQFESAMESVNGKKITVKRPPVLVIRVGITEFDCPVVDVGPHYGGKRNNKNSDPYWTNYLGNECRPKADSNGEVNHAGIDMTPACFDRIEGKEGRVHAVAKSDDFNGTGGGSRLKNIEWRFK